MDSFPKIIIKAEHPPGVLGLEYTLLNCSENSHQIIKEIFSNVGRGIEPPFCLEFQFDELAKKYLEINRSINHYESEQVFKSGLLLLFRTKKLSAIIDKLNNYEQVISGFLREWSGSNAGDVNLYKFDLWIGLSDNPAFVAKVKLTKKEVEGLMKSTNDKLLSRHEYSLSGLPTEILLEKIIPSILLRITSVQEKVAPHRIEELFDLSIWKLGLG